MSGEIILRSARAMDCGDNTFICPFARRPLLAFQRHSRMTAVGLRDSALERPTWTRIDQPYGAVAHFSA
jgi:hypothetical protein